MAVPAPPVPPSFRAYADLVGGAIAGRRTRSISDELPAGRCIAMRDVARSEPVALPGCDRTCTLYGRLRWVLRFEDGSWGLVQMVTGQPDAGRLERCRRRLHALAWAMERPGDAGWPAGPVSHMGLLALYPDALRRFDEHAGATVRLRKDYIPIDRHDAAFERFLVDVMTTLASDEPPPGDAACAWCAFHAARAEADPGYRHDGLPF